MKKSKSHCNVQEERLVGSEHSTNFFDGLLPLQCTAVKGRDAIQWFNNKNFDFDQCCSISDYPVSIKYVDPLKERLPITVVVAEGV